MSIQRGRGWGMVGCMRNMHRLQNGGAPPIEVQTEGYRASLAPYSG